MRNSWTLHNMNKNILVIGGYGEVGRVIANHLAIKFPGQVIVAGRDFSKAQNLSLETNGKIVPSEFDSLEFDDEYFAQNNVGTSIMCVDSGNVEIAKACIKNNVNYIDISANYKILSEIAAIGESTKEVNSTIMLSVGLAPGLSNLLVKHCQSKSRETYYANIYVLLGTGEAHGRAAIEWTINNLNERIFSHTRESSTESFSNRKTTDFGGSIGKRVGYSFNFSDQYVVHKTLRIAEVVTRICFDSKIVGSLFYFLKRIGVTKLLKQRNVRSTFVDLLRKIKIGSDGFSLKVETYNKKKDLLSECYLSGNGQGKVTGKVAAIVAEKIINGSTPKGIFHLEQVFNIEAIVKEMADCNIKWNVVQCK